MRVRAFFLVVGVLAFVPRTAPAQEPSAHGDGEMREAAAATYEHLANVIIESKKTEDQLVRSILVGYHHAAQIHLGAAAAGRGDRKTHLEAAATEIANIANEGDKRIQAIRQRLAKAGHTHNTDKQTKEDYMFIDSKEKKEFLAAAREIAGLDKEADVRGASEKLAAAFRKAIAEE